MIKLIIKIGKALSVVLICLFLSVYSFGQPITQSTFSTTSDDPPCGDDCGEGDPQGVPLDGGIIWLLVGGAAYGAKKLHDQRKNKANPET